MLRSTLLALAAASLASAHFILYYPPTAGFVDDDEPTSPCGGASVVVNGSAPEVSVDQFAISIFSSHPTGEWGFRGTTDTEEPYNFTEIVPVVNTTGAGVFCLTDLRVPSEWAGQSGVLQVIDNSIDGVLYQCAPVRFVSGSNTTAGSTCSNATGFAASWTAAETLNTSDTQTSSSSTSDAPTGSATPAATSTSATSTGMAAMVTGFGSVMGLGLLAAGLAL